MEILPPPIPIGTIVALNSHPFFSNSDKESILISGEPTMLSPLMVVVEILLERKFLFEEHTGVEISGKETYQCKCLWYSLKSHQFEEAWLSSKLLKILSRPNSNNEIPDSFPFGTTVMLKTNNIELGKKKSSLKKSNKDSDNLITTTSLLSFVSPTMHVIGNLKNEIKDPLIDPKTGFQKRWVSNKTIKCKFYNPHNDKLSEFILPIEAVVKVITASKELISFLKKMIAGKTLFKIEKDSLTRVFKPIAIHHKAGMHFLECKDYVENKLCEIQIKSMRQFKQHTTVIESLPNFTKLKTKLTINPIDLSNLRRLDQDKLWRISYKDNLETITKRTIYNPEYFISLVKDASGKNSTKVDYIKANCLLRNKEERYFRIDRIMLLEVLDINSSEYL